MKFVCNNCGFTADIPEQMSVCPMCGSSNVSSAAEALKFPADAEENEDENAKAQNFKAAAGPTQRVTLTEGMNVGEKSDYSTFAPLDLAEINYINQGSFLALFRDPERINSLKEIGESAF